MFVRVCVGVCLCHCQTRVCILLPDLLRVRDNVLGQLTGEDLTTVKLLTLTNNAADVLVCLRLLETLTLEPQI